ncbi:MAG TPA: uroporphyrinogen-III synthase [Bacillota bacterium]|nr:uroporphyrinogen-III synthase [Bacillota bacterium]
MKPNLDGKCILITRPRKQAEVFAEKIEQAGGRPVIIDLLQIDCFKDQMKTYEEIRRYDWFFFTSANGVHCYFRLYGCLPESGKVAAVGPKTAMALRTHGHEADFIPHIYHAETMASAFGSRYNLNQSVLLIQGQRARPVLEDVFTASGRSVSTLKVYETHINNEMKGPLQDILESRSLDIMTFTSPSTVEAFAALGDVASVKGMAVVCIGTTTERAARAVGFSTVIIPSTYTIEGMIAAMSDYIKGDD